MIHLPEAPHAWLDQPTPNWASPVFKRQHQIRSHYSYARRHGMDALRGSTQSALRGEKVLDFSYLLIGALLWPDLRGLLDRISQGLQAQEQEHRIAATFAAACYIDQEQVACLLAERVVVEQGERLTVQAAREVLEIIAHLELGGACPRCRLMRTSTKPRLDDLDVNFKAVRENLKEKTT